MEYQFTVFEPGQSERQFQLQGRKGWALNELASAGERGCTPSDNPAPRWSAYIHKLQHEYGLAIETIHESHGGPFASTHARYVLHSNVRVVKTLVLAD